MLSINRVIFILIVELFFFSCLAFPNTFAATPATLQKTESVIRQEHALELELFRVKAEINNIKNRQGAILAANTDKSQNLQAPSSLTFDSMDMQKEKSQKAKDSQAKTDAENSANLTLPQDASPTRELGVYQTIINYMNGLTVFTTPLLGLKSAWQPTDLLYTIPAMNEDLILLQNIEAFGKILRSMGGTLNERPILVLSGAIEGINIFTNSYTNANSNDVDLNSAEIDLWPIVSHWADGFMSFTFNDAPSQVGARTANAALYLQRGFVTIGHLDHAPVYFTIGQMYIPFGSYTSAMVTSPLTLSVARSNQRAMVLGYYKNGLYSQGYLFSGNRITGGSHLIIQSGFNIGYEWQKGSETSLDIGMGYVSNMADSNGMQANALDPGGALRAESSQFAGFSLTFNANNQNADNLKHNVGGLDFHMKLTEGKYTLITEIVSSIRHFDPGDLLFANHGAQPGALQFEFDYNPVYYNIPCTFGVAYGQTWEALPLNVPQYSFFLVAEASIWKDTQLSLEYRHDINYPYTPNTGGGGNGDRANVLPVPSANVGGSRDLISVLLGIYF